MAGGGLSLVVVLGLLIAMASVVWILGSRPQAQEFWYTDLVPLRHVESSPSPDQRSNQCLLHWQEDSLPPSHFSPGLKVLS